MNTPDKRFEQAEPRVSPTLEGHAHQLRLIQQPSGTLQLSQEAMLFLLDQTKQGQRNLARSVLSRILNVNDVVAEYCLRHLEEKLRDEPAYVNRVITQLNALMAAKQSEQLKFLQYAFGVHGMVSEAILNFIRNPSTAS